MRLTCEIIFSRIIVKFLLKESDVIIGTGLIIINFPYPNTYKSH